MAVRQEPGPLVVNWWDDHYRHGGTSGVGSYGLLAEFKAETLNGLLGRYGVRSAVEFGCGDGHQLSLIDYPQYVGVDVSAEAVRRCRDRFWDDPSKTFMLLDDWTGGTFDLAVSLDVIYHLEEDAAFERHMGLLFGSAPLVVIYSTDGDGNPGTGIWHRRFTDWTAEHVPDWGMERIVNLHPELSLADFYIFRA